MPPGSISTMRKVSIELDAIEARDSRCARQRLEERETELDLIAALEVRQNQGQIRIDDAALKALNEEMRDDLLSEDVAVARSMRKPLMVKLKVKNEGGTLTWTFPHAIGFWSVPPRGYLPKTCHGSLSWRRNT